MITLRRLAATALVAMLGFGAVTAIATPAQAAADTTWSSTVRADTTWSQVTRDTTWKLKPTDTTWADTTRDTTW